MQGSIEIMAHICKAMETKSISIIKMCEEVGIGESTFWRYKKGITIPPLDRLMAMSNVVQVSLDELTRGISTNPTPPRQRKPGKSQKTA